MFLGHVSVHGYFRIRCDGLFVSVSIRKSGPFIVYSFSSLILRCENQEPFEHCTVKRKRYRQLRVRLIQMEAQVSIFQGRADNERTASMVPTNP